METEKTAEMEVEVEVDVTNEQAESSLQSELIPSHPAYSDMVSTGACAVDPNDNEITPAQDMGVDFSNVFTTHELFSSRDTLFDWVRARGVENGIVVTIGRSQEGCGNKRPRMYLTCERSGQYREKKTLLTSSQEMNGGETVEQTAGKKTKRRRETKTKKCGCPFRLKGRQVNDLGEWELNVICGVHNHPTAECSEGHSYVGRLMKPEEEYVADISNANSKPKDILFALKQKFANNKSTIRTIYNARMKIKGNKRDGRSEMQQLMQKLEEHGYYHICRRCEVDDTIKDLFFAHPGSIELLRAFPYVILMDCTYKSNRYKRALLEIVGVTSTQMTFSIAAAYLEFEQEDNYIWACTVLKSLMDQSCLPNVIVTDREIALMNAIETTFPTSRHFLCRWHINRNILANCKEILKTKANWDAFNLNWNLLVIADTESKFNDMVSRLFQDFNEFPNAVNYVMEQWVTPYKERFVSYWTNNVMHFDNMTVNRVDTQHLLLRKQLGSNQSNFESSWRQIHSIIETSHNAIKHSLEKSKLAVQHKFKSILFEELRGMVSINALKMIFDEMNYLDENGVDALSCQCVMRKTCGLPCPHELTEFVRLDSPIPLNRVHAFWRKLDTSTVTEDMIDVRQEQDRQFKECWIKLTLKFEQASESERTLILKRLMEISAPTTSRTKIPVVRRRARLATSTGSGPCNYATKSHTSHFGSCTLPTTFLLPPKRKRK